ncbi:MAG: class I SAM-dependent methyltransferase [Thermoplasmata archaeon]
MKDKHTSIYFDPKHYDAMYTMKEDIPFYLDCVKEYGEPVLELACGTGRVTVPMAERNIDITGMDISQEMLEFTRNKALKKGIDIDLVRGDMRDFSMGRKFNIIFIAINSILHLIENEEYEALFSSVREHLAEHGRFIFQIFNPDMNRLRMEPDEERTAADYDDPYGRGKVLITERSYYDTAEQVKHLTWYYHIDEELETEVEWKIRILFPKEINALLKYNGFQIEKKYGNFDRSEFTDESEKQIIICKKR